ncbi:MAG: ABC transporter ATP-binding protein [bacterium]
MTTNAGQTLVAPAAVEAAATPKRARRRISLTRPVASVRMLVNFYRTFGDAVLRDKSVFVAALVSSLGTAICEVAKPLPLKLLFDNVIMTNGSATVLPWIGDLSRFGAQDLVLGCAAALLGVSMLGALFSYGETYYTAAAGQKAAYRIRKTLVSHLHGLPLAFHARHRTGDLLVRMTGDVELVKSLLVPGTLTAVGRVFILAGTLVAMLLIDKTLTYCILGVAPLLLILFVRFSSRIRDASRKQRQREGELASHANESFQSMPLVQAYAAEDVESDRILRSSRRSLRAGLRATRLEAKLAGTTDVVIAAGTAIVMWVGAQRVLSGLITPGDIIMFTSYLRAVYKPVRKMAALSARGAKAIVGGERLVEILRTPIDEDPPTCLPAANLRGAVTFDDVSFGYRGDDPVLHHISFDIPAGARVALVGPSGAGKSSLVSLIPRLYEPQSGRILIDGHDAKLYARRSLRERIAIVFQDSLLLGLSVRENIAFGRSGVSDEEITRAARLARIHDRIVALPSGYDTTLDERGASLSGGERRRIAIARALLRDAAILILDEPTTGADVALELALMKTLLAETRGRTAFIISHRFQLIEEAEIVVMIEGGTVRAVGPHETLLRENREYRAFYHASAPEAQPSGALLAESDAPVRAAAGGGR